jgi:hypothetical protein
MQGLKRTVQQTWCLLVLNSPTELLLNSMQQLRLGCAGLPESCTQQQ